MTSHSQNHGPVRTRVQANRRPQGYYRQEPVSKGDFAQDNYDEGHYEKPQRFLSDNESKSSEENLSTGSVSGYENNDGREGSEVQEVEETYRDYNEPKREKIVQETQYQTYTGNPKRTVTAYNNETAYDNARNIPPRKAAEYPVEKTAYDPMKDPTFVARKLQKLKELERRRDITEKHYNQEIRRIIGDYKFLTNQRPMTVAAPRSPEEQRSLGPGYAGDRDAVEVQRAPPDSSSRSSFEACGTMTTITRLDCGCVEQTTRPIFTTQAGRVQKRSCSREQQMQLRMTPQHVQVEGHTTTTRRSRSRPNYTEVAARGVGLASKMYDTEATHGRGTSPTRKTSENFNYTANEA